MSPLLIASLVLSGLAQDAPSPGGPDETRALFLAQCATCHGDDGGGKGVTVLPRPARSFLDGGFSYGNTREAIMRTVTHGIPGTPMPGFSAALDEAQRESLVEYVISLGPERKEVKPKETALAVGSRAQVVRGFLPGVIEGAPEFPRGLLVGLPTGTTFQYRADDIRLIAVRQGEFVERRDWGGRGGNPLNPLGRVTFLCDQGRPDSTFTQGTSSFSARLGSTRIESGLARIAYRILDGSGEVVARVAETPRNRTTTFGAGFERHFVIFAERDVKGLEMDVLNRIGEVLPIGAELDGTRLTTTASRAADGSVLAVAVSGPEGLGSAGDRLVLDLNKGTTTELSVTLVATAQWTEEVALALSKEIAQ